MRHSSSMHSETVRGAEGKPSWSAWVHRKYSSVIIFLMAIWSKWVPDIPEGRAGLRAPSTHLQHSCMQEFSTRLAINRNTALIPFEQKRDYKVHVHAFMGSHINRDRTALWEKQESLCIKAIRLLFLKKFSIENCNQLHIFFFCQVLKYSIVQSEVPDHIPIYPVFFMLKYSGASLQPPAHQDGSTGSSQPSRNCKMGSVTPHPQPRSSIIPPPAISTSPL